MVEARMSRKALLVRGVLTAAAVLAVSSGTLAQATGGAAQPEVRRPEAAPAKLAVGDKAPELMVAKWIKGEPVTGFEKGKPYVVEFWATWCGPCKKSIPHLTELQKKHKDKVTIIGVSTWEQGGVEPVQKFVEDWGSKMDYTVGFDDGDKMSAAWMKPAGLRGIPAAFIVDQEGRIAWIGNPIYPVGEIDEALELAVAGKLTPEASRELTKRFEEKGKKERELVMKVQTAMQAGDHAAAVAAADELIKANPANEATYGPLKFRILLTGAKDHEKAYAYGRTLVSGPVKGEAGALNEIAWLIVDPENPVGTQDLNLALQAATQANELTGGKDPAIVDTLAKVHWDRGEKDKAVELQEKAAELAKGTPFEQEINARLEEYRKAPRGG